MNLMQPPTASQDGAAHISYPINIPPGRNGMQPNLSIQYNSEGGNGWMGLGWNLSTPAITLDTRWGVPEFAAHESEIYLLSGEQLVYPKTNPLDDDVPYLPHRHKINENGLYDTEHPQPRNVVGTTKQFYLRKEGSFTKIERLGSSPSNYYWKVTSTDSKAILRGINGSIVHWALFRVVDVNNNAMTYLYNEEVIENPTGINSNLAGGRQLYLEKIRYTDTRNPTTNTINQEGKFTIEFIRDASIIRQDISINGRLGFKQVDAKRLNSINIQYDSELIRSYNFTYKVGDFGKSLLDKVIEKDKNGTEFYKHELKYFVREAKDAFGKPETHTDNVSSIPNNKFLVNINGFSGQGTALGSSTSENWSYGTYFGIGVGANPVSKATTFGVASDISGGLSKAFVAQMDIDGDGLPDKVYRRNGTLVYKKHTLQPVYGQNGSQTTFRHVFSDYLPISQMDNIYRSEDEISANKGFQLNFPKGSAGCLVLKKSLQFLVKSYY